jgi:hypothetical protein
MLELIGNPFDIRYDVDMIEIPGDLSQKLGKVTSGFQVSFDKRQRFSESISSISAVDKSRQTRVLETSDFYNGNHVTKNPTLAPPVVNSSDYVVKHGSNAF